MTRLDEIKARLKKVADIKDNDYLFDVCNTAAGGGYYLGGCYVDTHEQVDAAQEFVTGARADVGWLIEQLEKTTKWLDQRNKQLIKVMKTSNESVDKITELVDKLARKVGTK